MARTRIPIPPAWRRAMAEEHRRVRLETPIAEILPMRTVNALEEHGGMIYVKDLVQKSIAELATLSGFGDKTVTDIENALQRLELALRENNGG